MRFLPPSLAFLLVLLCSPAVSAWTLTGRVVAVVSGDTIKVQDERRVQHTVRLAGIDAPEKFQQYGQRSLDSLRELVFQRNVAVLMPGNDRSAPRVGKVLVEERDANLQQLQLGYAWYAKAHAGQLSAEDRQAYADAEAQARVQRAGLWRDAKPIPPWEYRQGRRK